MEPIDKKTRKRVERIQDLEKLVGAMETGIKHYEEGKPWRCVDCLQTLPDMIEGIVVKIRMEIEDEEKGESKEEEEESK